MARGKPKAGSRPLTPDQLIKKGKDGRIRLKVMGKDIDLRSWQSFLEKAGKRGGEQDLSEAIVDANEQQLRGARLPVAPPRSPQYPPGDECQGAFGDALEPLEHGHDVQLNEAHGRSPFCANLTSATKAPSKQGCSRA